MEKKYILTEHFTLIPEELCTPEQARKALQEQFPLTGEYRYGIYIYKKADAAVAYALPAEETPSGEYADEKYPFIVKLLEETDNIPHYNKVVFHYCNESRLSHTIITTGNGLKLANTFKADSFESALYFLFLSIQRLQMNPKQCIIRVCSGITGEQEATISRFFNGLEKNNLDKFIEK